MCPNSVFRTKHNRHQTTKEEITRRISRTITLVIAGLMLSGIAAYAQSTTPTNATATEIEQATTAAKDTPQETPAEAVKEGIEKTEPPEQSKESAAAQPAEEDSSPAAWAAKASNVLKTQMTDMPDKRIPEAIIECSRCVAVFPSVVKAGFVFGAKRGDGLISCRDEKTGAWGAPAFFRMKGVSWGLQFGAQVADVILIIMNQEGVNGLLKAKVTLGGDIGVTAGPVGRNASVGTDLLLKSPMFSYARSKGVFAGLGLEGSTITFNKEENEKLYGTGMNASGILFGTETVLPNELHSFHSALKAYAPQFKPFKEAQPGENAPGTSN